MTYFRVALACATGAAWLLFAALALHRSGDPEVFGRYSVAYAGLLAATLGGCAALTLANHPRWLARIATRRRELLLLPASLGLALLGAELFLRVFDPIGIGYYSEMRRYERDRVPDPVLAYRHPRATTRRYQDVEHRYNATGLRDDSIAPKRDDEFRVIVLGDSITFGWGVEQEQTFPAVLQGRLAQALGRPVRVINTGVCSYNTVMELTWLREHGFALAPDLVVLLYVPNDVVVQQAIWSPAGARARTQRPALDLAISLLARSWLFRLLLHIEQHRDGRSVPGDPSEPGWQASMAALRELATQAQARGIGVAVYLWSTGRLDASQAGLLAAMRAALAPVAVEETGSWFADAPARHWMNSRIDPHPNARGHARLAERMQASLEAQGLLAPETQRAPGLDGDRGPLPRGEGDG